MTYRARVARRSFLLGSGAALVASGAAAQSPFPARPLRLVVGYAPASGADVVARLVAPKLGEALGQSVIVENKPGAGGVIAAQEFIRATADGHTLLLAAMPQLIINHATNAKLGYHPVRDFEPVSQIVSTDLVLVVNPQSTPVADLKAFMDWSRAQQQTYFGTPGQGTVGHFLAAMFADTAKAKVEPVHFRATGDSVTALLSGQIHALFVTYTVAESLARAGKFKALAVTSAARARQFPDAPTMREAGFPGLEAGSWYGVFAPKGVPENVLEALSQTLVRLARTPEVSAKRDDAGMTVTALDRRQFGRGVNDDLEMWTRAVKATGFTTGN